MLTDGKKNFKIIYLFAWRGFHIPVKSVDKHIGIQKGIEPE